MSTAKLLLALSILIVLSELTKCKKIQVFSDFSAENDKKFFAAVYPWLVSNVPKIKVKYFFKDGEPGAKRMCTVSVLKSAVKQAKFLQCQAEGKADCNEEQIAKKKGHKKCMENYQSNMKAAAKAFRRYNVCSTPVIFSGLSKMTTDNPMVLLKKMCKLYLFFRPRGCKKPSALIDTKNKESKSEIKKKLKDDDGENSAEDDAEKSKESSDESEDNSEKSDDNSKESNKDDDDKKSDDGSEKFHNNNDDKYDKVDTEKLSKGGDKKSDVSGGAIDPKKD